MLHLRRVHGVALAVLVVLVLRGLFWGHPRPLASDPIHWLTSTAPRPVELIGRLVEDARPFDGGCSGLLAVRRLDGEQAKGRTQLLLRPCPVPVPLQGWSVSARGQLQRPAPGGHPLVIGSSERLARRGSWTQLKVQSLSVLHRPNTPLVSVRRRIGQHFISSAGPDQGALLAALVLGSAQVSVPEALRESVRVAGLSHALAASGFHLASHAFYLPDQTKKESRNSFKPISYNEASGQLVLKDLQNENPLLRSGVVLAGANRTDRDESDDGYLTALEVSQLNLSGTELVVISGCDSGLGDIKVGEGIYGLKRAIAVAGARSSLLSLWKVEDKATAAFMTSFYTKLKTGMGRADALSATQKEFREHQNEDWREPYVWAAFQLSGDWGPIEGL